MAWKSFPLTAPSGGQFARGAFASQTSPKAGDARDPLKSGRSMWAKRGGCAPINLRVASIRAEPEARPSKVDGRKKLHVGHVVFLRGKGWGKARTMAFLGITEGQWNYALRLGVLPAEPEGWKAVAP